MQVQGEALLDDFKGGQMVAEWDQWGLLVRVHDCCVLILQEQYTEPILYSDVICTNEVMLGRILIDDGLAHINTIPLMRHVDFQLGAVVVLASYQVGHRKSYLQCRIAGFSDGELNSGFMEELLIWAMQTITCFINTTRSTVCMLRTKCMGSHTMCEYNQSGIHCRCK